MIFSCNRFAIIPHICHECKRYIWLESYRRADVWKYDRFIMENICKQCLPKFLDVDITYKEENMDNTVTRIERRADGSYIVTVNGKNFECEDTQAMLSFLEEVGEGKV